MFGPQAICPIDKSLISAGFSKRNVLKTPVDKGLL
jgi:hypothetical protein